MAKYLKEFSTNAEYEAYISNTNYLPNVSLVDEDDSVKYKQKPDYSKEYLTLVALERGALRFYKQGTGNDIQYSLDGGETWTTLRSAQFGTAVDAGHKILIKAELTPTYSYGIGSIDFGLSDVKHSKYYIEGNVMSLLYGDNFVGQTSMAEKPNSFVKLFSENNYHILTSAENLVLPATTLSNRCYYQMFYKCSSLTTAPELPATILASSCYSMMFDGCTNLTYIKMLATDISASNCLNGWVQGVSATGTFVKAASATLPTGNNGIPSGWTVQDA